MRKSRKMAVAVSVLLTVGVVALVLPFTIIDAFWGTKMEVSPTDQKDVDRLKEQGWLPAVLGSEATGIRMVYDLDSNLGFGMCRRPTPENVRTMMRLRPVEGAEAQRGFDATRVGLKKHPSWWPKDLAEQMQRGEFRLAADQHHIFASKDDILYFWLAERGV